MLFTKIQSFDIIDLIFNTPAVTKIHFSNFVYASSIPRLEYIDYNCFF